MSRLPRAQEFLKTGFNAEAASAARLRAHAVRAEADGSPNLARALRELAAEKDELARLQLEAAGQVHGAELDLAASLAEERYENDALYPRMSHEVDEPTAAVFRAVMERQQEHASRLAGMIDGVTRSRGDLPA